MADSNHNASSSGGVDPVAGFWRDIWARSAAAGMPGGAGAFGGAAPGPEAFASAFTPEMMRRMQAGFFEAMAQYAEEWMKSPAFFESMKRSMDQALQFRRQLDDFLRSNMGTAFENATGGANVEVLAALRQSTAQLQAQLSRIDERLAEIESRVSGRTSGASAPPKSQSKTGAPRAKKSARRSASKR